MDLLRRTAALAAGAWTLVALAACGARDAGVETAPPRGAEAPAAAEAPSGAGGEPGADAGEAGGSGEAASPVDAGAGTAARRASEHLVEEGVRLLEGGQADAAARTLERAVRLDPSHGMAYVHLARARAAQGRPSEAVGLLDRAIDLLRPYPERASEARRLRDDLRARAGGT